jgi:hypothetical protein
MPSVFKYFREQVKEFSCVGKNNESILVTRRGKSESSSVQSYDKAATFQDDTKFSEGDLLTNLSTLEKFFVVSQESSVEATIGQLKKVNASISLYSVSGNATLGYKGTMVNTYDSFQRVVTANMRQYDAGLLDTTVRKFILQNTISVSLNDRIVFDGKFYTVSAVDDGKYIGLIDVQVADDKRKVVIT